MKYILIVFILLCSLSADNWTGFALLELNTNAPQAHIDTALTIVGLAGISTTTVYPHLKSFVRPSLNNRKFIWKVTMKSNDPPSLDYLKLGMTNFTSLTGADVDNMIISFNILGDAAAVRTFIANNNLEWNVPIEGM